MKQFNCAACKYEYEVTWEKPKDPIKGDEPPREILLSNSISIELYNPQPFKENDKVNLWMCPKCNTVKVEVL